MFSAAFKNSLTERRHAVRVAAGVESMESAEGREAYAQLAGGYRTKMEARKGQRKGGGKGLKG